MFKRAAALIAFALTLSIPALAAEVPPTLPHPGINSQNGYRIGVTDLTSNTLLWSAPYHHELLYQSGTGWRNGDRIAYHCAYGFLTDNGVIVGRFTFRAVPSDDNNPDGAYIRINDTYMEDAPGSPQNTAGGPSRYYDGTQRPANIQTPFADCPQDVGVDYEAGNFPDEDPVIPFWNDGQVIEIRDYRNTVPAAGVTFQELDPITEPFQVTTSTGTHAVNDRRTVLARLDGVPVAVVYYDGLGTGQVIPDGAEPAPDDCNAIISMSQGGQVYAGSQSGVHDPAESELEALTGEQWMALINGGPNALVRWKSPAIWGGIVERNRCGTDSEIDRVLFIFDPRGSAAPYTNDLNVVVGILEGRYPNAEIDVSLLVGGAGHVVCTIVQRGQTQTVTASVTHKNAIGLMAGVPEAGPDLDVPCSGYADGLGHLNNVGAASAQAQVGAFYSGG